MALTPHRLGRQGVLRFVRPLGQQERNETMNGQTIDRQGLDVAVVGATGMVGRMLLGVLQERDFPIKRLRLLASERSVDGTLVFRDHRIPVGAASAEALGGADLVFFAATGELSRKLAPEAVRRGAMVVDKSSSFRMDARIPLVVPEINAHVLNGHRGIVASPNCTTTGLVMALEPLRRIAGLRSVVVTTFQAVSGAGREALEEFEAQCQADRNRTQLPARHFPAPIARNVIAQCDSIAEDGFSAEEHKLRNETRKILGLNDLPLTMTAVRVPVPVGHSAAVLVETERPLSLAEARASYAGFNGVRTLDSTCGPTPRDVVDSDEVLVGRLRQDFDPNRLWLWEVSNNLRKGAATNAVQIAEALLERRALDFEGAAERKGRAVLKA